MTNPVDYVMRGQELCQQQQMEKAEREFRRAIKAYDRQKDTDGIAFALGRLGDCYEKMNEVEKAIAAYRQAVDLKTDIPATYYGLIGLLVDKGELESAFEIAEEWQRYGGRQISGSTLSVFVDLGNSLTRKKRFEEAIRLLSLIVDKLKTNVTQDEYWLAKGSLGFAYEKSGKIEEAAVIFAEAIDEGSTDRRTFTRYLMYLEKEKRYDEALSIIRKGLKIQSDANWELDLRKRKQRIERKAGKATKGGKTSVIPIFSVRRGKATIALEHQIKFSPQVTNLVVSNEKAFSVSAGKNPKLTAHNLNDASLFWQVALPEKANGMIVTQNNVVTYSQLGRVGDGKTILYFWSKEGTEVSRQELPDSVSVVAGVADRVYAGCRNGELYAFLEGGRRLWSYTVPGSKGKFDSEYMRPCPFRVRAVNNLVVFSSFENLFALNGRGKLRWKWSVPGRETSTTSGGITITMSTGPSTIGDIAISQQSQHIIVSADDTVYEVYNGKMISQVRKKGKHIGKVTISPDNNIWAFSVNEQVYVLHNRKLSRRFKAPYGTQLSINPSANCLVAWSGRDLFLADLTGKVKAQLEFAKSISDVYCVDNGKLIVGAGQLVVLNTIIPPAPAKSPEAMPPKEHKTTPEMSKDIASLPKEERGIPLRWLQGKKLTSQGKARYESQSGQPLTIEQFALEEYARLGYTGSWTENDYWWAIMALLFWDVIFARLVGVYTPEFGDFPSKLQDMPTDFFSDQFYSRRKHLIERRIEELTKPRLFGLRKPSIEAELRASFRRHFGKPCRPINWERWNRVDELIVATKLLTATQLMTIMHRLLENFGYYRRGLPDLFIAKEGKALFVEVKSEKEKVAEHQIEWLQFLQDVVGCSVEICRITRL